jgi:NADH-quinone oxidoreductase subunit M
MTNIPWLSLITFSPLLGVLILLFVRKDRPQRIKTIGILATLVPLILSAVLLAGFDPTVSEHQFNEEASWIKIPLNEMMSNNQIFIDGIYLDYRMGADGLSVPLVFLTALITTLAALASVHIKKRWKAFYILLLILEVGMFGVFLARDVFLFFLFFEITLVPMFFLVGIWGYMHREQAANKFLIYNGIGSAAMLIGFLLLIYLFGTTAVLDNATGMLNITYTGSMETIKANLTDPASAYNDPGHMFYGLFEHFLGYKAGVFILLLIAFGIKLPIFPFHTWMLKVHVEAPPSIVMIHSGILLKMGAYGLFRFGVELFPDITHNWAMVLGTLGVINILYGAVLAFVQRDIKLVLAYSSISHMGIVLLGIAAMNTYGFQGAYFQAISHGLISALMFLMVGSIYERTGTTMMEELGGLAKAIPFMSGVLLTAGLALLGLPGLSGFVSEFLAFVGLFGSMPILTTLGALGIILTAAYVLRAVLRTTYGELPDKYKDLPDARPIEALPMIVLLSLIILLGVYPAILSDFIQTTIYSLVESVDRIGG